MDNQTEGRYFCKNHIIKPMLRAAFVLYAIFMCVFVVTNSPNKALSFVLFTVSGIVAIIIIGFIINSKLFGVTLFKDNIQLRKFFIYSSFGYDKIKSICIVQDKIRGRIAVDNNEIDLHFGKGGIKHSVKHVYKLFLLDYQIEKDYRNLSVILENSINLKNAFRKSCITFLRYRADFLEELLSHKNYPIYLRQEVFQDIKGEFSNVDTENALNENGIVFINA